MMSQMENSNEKIFLSDENLYKRRAESDSQDFYSSKNEFSQSVLCQVDQMSQYIRNFDNDGGLFVKDRRMREDAGAGRSLSQEAPQPLLDSFKSNIDNQAQESGEKANKRVQDLQSKNVKANAPIK